MKVLVAGESDGVIRDAFRGAGHDAISCSLPTDRSDNSYFHIKGEIEPIIQLKWDLIIVTEPMKWDSYNIDRFMKCDVRGKCIFINHNTPSLKDEDLLKTQVIRKSNFGGKGGNICLWIDNIPLIKPPRFFYTKPYMHGLASEMVKQWGE